MRRRPPDLPAALLLFLNRAPAGVLAQAEPIADTLYPGTQFAVSAVPGALRQPGKSAERQCITGSSRNQVGLTIFAIPDAARH